MQLINAQNGKLSTEHFKAIIATLDKGGVIIFPTETVYGLMCRHGDQKAKKRIFDIKNRPLNKHLQCLVTNQDSLNNFDIEISPLAQKIMTKFFPGKLTIILENRNGETLGFRCPKSSLLQTLLQKLSYPLWSTSANLSGEKDNLKLEEIIKTLSKPVDFAIKNDDFSGLASTVIEVIGNDLKVLRHGHITLKQLEKVKNNSNEK